MREFLLLTNTDETKVLIPIDLIFAIDESVDEIGSTVYFRQALPGCHHTLVPVQETPQEIGDLIQGCNSRERMSR